MIEFIIGLFLGLFLGWLRLRQMAKTLNTLTTQSTQLREALTKASALIKAFGSTFEALGEEHKRLVELKEPAPTTIYQA